MARITRWISISERCSMLYRMQAFKDLGLPACQHMYIYYLCNHPEGIKQDELAYKVYVNKSNVTRNIKSLEENGFVKRIVDNEDKRAYKVYPTDKAFNILPIIKGKMSYFNEVLCEGLSEEEVNKLNDLLIKVANNASNFIDKNYEE